jgi:hypothetical protein
MKDQIMVFCNERGLLNRFQSGFRHGHSTTTALLNITDDISMEMDRGFTTILAFLEAFDTVDFKLLSENENHFLFLGFCH